MSAPAPTVSLARADAGSRVVRLWSAALANSLAAAPVEPDLALLSSLPTLETLTVFPDVLVEPPGIGVPVGVSFVTAGTDALVVPNGVTDVNDGYRLERLNVGAREVRACAEAILAELASCSTREETLSERKATAILSEGAAAIMQPDDAHELRAIWQRGRVEVSDVSAIGAEAFSTLRHTFGTFGRYGHFLELLEVASVANPRCPLERGDVLLVVHAGAMEVSDIVNWQAYFDFAESAAALGLVSDDHFLAGMFGLPRAHPLAERFIEAAAAVANAAYAWRYAVARRVAELLGRALGRTVRRELLSDLPHNRLSVEGAQVRHAKGVQPLCAAGERARCAIICGGLGIHSYLVGPKPGRDTAEACHGAAHCTAFEDGDGAPRGTSRLATNQPHAVARDRERALGVRNIEESLRSLEQVGWVERLARLEPLVNFRGRPKPRLRYDLPGREIVRDLVVANKFVVSSTNGRR